jgi:probable HAF family extracellular repeat protein
MTDLGGLFGRSYSLATGINDNGQIVGCSQLSSGGVDAFSHNSGQTTGSKIASADFPERHPFEWCTFAVNSWCILAEQPWCTLAENLWCSIRHKVTAPSSQFTDMLILNSLNTVNLKSNPLPYLGGVKRQHRRHAT